MAALKYYDIKDGQLERNLPECPDDMCGGGIFMGFYGNRWYCGKCHLVWKKRDQIEAASSEASEVSEN